MQSKPYQGEVKSGLVVSAAYVLHRAQVEDIHGEVVAEEDYQMELVIRRARKDTKMFLAGSIVHLGNRYHAGQVSVGNYIETRALLGKLLVSITGYEY